MNHPYRLDEKGIPYRVGALAGGNGGSGPEESSVVQAADECGKLKNLKTEDPDWQISCDWAEAYGKTAGGSAGPVTLLHHGGQLQSFRLYLFS